MTLIDSRLVSAAGDGDRAAQERLLSLYAPVTRRIIRRTLSRRFPLWEDGDARQVAELSCVECAMRCPDTAGFAGYYATAALRRCLRERRLYAPGFVIPEDGDAPEVGELEEDAALVPPPDAMGGQSESVAHMLALVDTLPEKLRVVLIRRYGLYGAEPMSKHRAGCALGIDEETVARREAKALSILRQKARQQ